VAALIGVAAGAYGLTFGTRWGAAAVLVALPCVLMLARVRTPRQAFYVGLAAGIGMYGPHLLFFWSVFGPVAVALWLVAGLPMAAFVLLLHLMRKRFGENWASWLTPVLWMGVEYFRSECYYLKFAWLLPGQAAAFLPGVRLERIGVYGLGFLYVSTAAMIVSRSRKIRVIGVVAAALFATLMYVPTLPPAEENGSLHVAGVQLEQADEQPVADALDRLAIAHPEAQILVLSEYSFAGPVPEVVRDVLRKHQRYLIAGGMKLLPQGQFYDTAFVIGPDGQDVFEQVKSVPVQFMGDGLPAPQRRVWESPWGKIGVAICYDVSYARVMDDFVRQGAEGLILPTMDVVTWGEYERRMLHGRLAPVRSAEYGIPVFSVWSSGVSQLLDRRGCVIATAGYPGQGEMIGGPFDLEGAGRVPVDRWVAMGAVIGTGIFIVYLVVLRIAEQLSIARGAE
jgi:apolipoprotein N-acyltransferase